jgi:tetratricopeptide (TPR) repeat protein
MGKSPESKLTLRQVLSGQWQIPLFAVSMVTFAGVLWQLRPKEEQVNFEQQLEGLKLLAEENRFHDFYVAAEQVRHITETEKQLGCVHGLVAQTRVNELKQRHELGLDLYQRRSTKANYGNIIKDYREALHRNWIDPNGPASAEVYHNISLACWGLSDTEKAIVVLNKAIKVSDKFNPTLHRSLVQMYMTARPKGYLEKSLLHLKKLLTSTESNADDKAWAFVRKTEVLIEQGHESQALAMLNAAGEGLRNSAYGDELVLLRGKALRHAGQADEADLILRELISRMTDRGDTYAQVALELGKINYEQYRDHDARGFYECVVTTQLGKCWYVGGKLGLAECAALQQRYDEAVALYQETVKLIKNNGPNRAVKPDNIQNSLVQLADQLALLNQYALALPFLEIEQQIAAQNDLRAADRFARIHIKLAEEMLRDMKQNQRAALDTQSTDDEQWLQQQQDLITKHFEQAAEQFLRVVSLAAGEDELYEDSLWFAATCYDKAGNSNKAKEVWRRFVDQCEGKSRWPRAMYYLAQTHQALGEFGQAVTYYQALREKHSRSPAALQSIVPLAHCYLMKDEPDNKKAEYLLTSVLEDVALRPLANVFREALFELGELYYNNKNYPQAITRLIEAIDRYPDEPELGKYMFLVGDSYRKSGLGLDAILHELSQDASATVSREKKTNLRRSHLKQAQDYYSEAVDFYEKIPESRRTKLDNLYLRHSWLYRADCLFDLGLYKQAALFYEEVALRYQLTPTALTAFVQIANCHSRLGDPAEADSANRRAIWQLAKMSDTTLAASPVSLDRQQWEQWFEWKSKQVNE